MDKWIIAIGKHKVRVSGKKWVAVQNIIEDNIPTGKKPAKMHNDYSLLSGLIYCDKCGNRMFAKQRSGKSGNPELYDYVCNSKLRGGTELCDCQNIGGQQADDMVCEYLMKYTDESSSIYKLLEKLKRDLQGQVRENPISGIDARIKKCNEEMDNLVHTLSQGNLGSAFVQRVNARITELDKQLSDLAGERERLQKDVNRIADKEVQVDMLAGALSSLKNNFDTLSVHERRTLIKLLVKKIVWDGKDLHIFIDGE